MAFADVLDDILRKADDHNIWNGWRLRHGPVTPFNAAVSPRGAVSGTGRPADRGWRPLLSLRDHG